MMGRTITSLSLLAILTTAVIAEKCVPGDNCKPPNCRCWDDPKAPGGFDTRDIPQMIVLSFQYGVSVANVDRYTNLLKGILNPNSCPARATLFPTKKDTQFNVVKELYSQGYEVGVSTLTSAQPVTEDDWAGNFSTVKDDVVKAGIPKVNVTGARAPELAFGGDKQVRAMISNALQYDMSCVNIHHSVNSMSSRRYDAGNFLWPYTFDFVEDTPGCTGGTTVKTAFPGIWEMLLADLQFQGHKCASPSACSPYIKTEKDAFDLFYNTFSLHYNQKTRPPFFMFIDPNWLTNVAQANGTKQFLQFVGAAFEDTWIVTAQQALDWIQDPVPAANDTTFPPWGC